MLTVSDLVSPARLDGVAPLAAAVVAKATVILVLGALAVLVARGASAATRHLIWTLALAGTLVVPMLAWCLPRLDVPMVPRWVLTAASDAAMRPIPSAFTSGTIGIGPSTGGVAAAADPAVVVRQPSRGVASAAAPAVLTVATPGGAPVRGVMIPAGPSTDGRTPAPWTSLAPWALVVWLTGVLIALLPMAAGTLRLAALARRARPLRGGAWALLAPTAMREIGVRRRVALAELDEPVMPMTWGVFHPVVLLPAGDFGSTVAERLDVLRHELAHVRRYDCLTQMIGRVACAVHWFNPLAWLAARQLRLERERACDDEVLGAGTKASDYADYLLRVARSTRLAHAAAFAGVAMARPSQLASRLLAVLDERRHRGRVSRRVATEASLTAAVIVATIASLAPASGEAHAVVAPSQRVVATTTHNGFRVGPLVLDEPARPAVEAATAALAGASAGAAPAESPASAREATHREGMPGVAMAAVRVVPAARALAAECDRDARSGRSSHTNWTSSDNGAKRWRALWSEGDCSYEVDARGDIRFNRDVTDVESISAGGSFILEQHVGDDTKRIAIRPGANGMLERTYTVNGATHDYDATARAWFAAALIALDRKTAFAVEQRLPVILERGGVDAVLREISLLDADYARRRYYSTLLSLRSLDATQVQHVVERAGADISSDYELAELLIDLSKRYAIDDRTRPAYVKAVGAIESDYEHRRVLSAIIAGGDLTPAVTRALLEDARRIASDYELAEFLIAVGRKGLLDASSRDAYFAAADKLASHYEHRRALTPLLTRDLLTKDLAKAVLASAAKIDSDYECASLLVDVANAVPIDDDLRPAYERAAATIGGEYEYGRAMAPVRRRATK